MTTTATAPPDIAPTLARVLKNRRLADILFVLSTTGTHNSMSLEITTDQSFDPLRANLDLLNTLGLVVSETTNRVVAGRANSIAPKHAEAVANALADYQKAEQFEWVLRDPPKPKSRRGLTLAGTCR